MEGRFSTAIFSKSLFLFSAMYILHIFKIDENIYLFYQAIAFFASNFLRHGQNSCEEDLCPLIWKQARQV